MQQVRLFRVYNHYRLATSLVLVLLLMVDVDLLQMQLRSTASYQVTAIVYSGINLFIGLLLLAGFRAQQRHITLSILIDIVMLHLLLLFSSGITSGLTNLVIIAVAAGNILVPSRIGILFAALATLCSLGLATWGSMLGLEKGDAFLRAAVLGILYFAAAFLLQNITRRLSSSEALARERARSIAELEQLNHQIIQRMRTGILVCDPRGSLRMANAAARELLCEPGQPTLNTLPQPLQLRLEEWLNNPDSRSDAFRARPTLPQIQPSLTRLHQEGDALILIFLEDTSKIAQQAQQLKLASLGRLTAAIAHEIRNPLGAISHAAQLLAESETLTKADRKMCDIIQRHSRRVNTIVENVLQLSRRTATRSERIELNRWLGTFVTDFSQSCQEPCELRLEPHANDPEGLFDPSQLEQVLTNLVENGLRYSAQRTGRRFVILRVGMTEDGERNYIEVQDEGPGIPVEQRDSVFEPFYTTEQGGTGLGLYIARELCEANQAQLTVVPGRGPGACFRLLLAYRGRQP